jgi:BirA family transcriptional regulator, biotin operon repressor / biotin---[acetyl-CoA-carboxylase] ligase
LPLDLAAAFSAARARLAPLGDRVLFFNNIGSTNDVALSLAAEPASEGAIVIADTQTAGRGRLGRRWFSPPDSGLYVSVVLRPPSSEGGAGRATGLLTLTAGVALVEAVEAFTGLRADIKWPNDVHVERRKLAGVLAEVVGVGRQIVLGYGINVGVQSFPSELGDRATSLEHELGRPIDRWGLCVETLTALSARYRDLLSGRFDAILDAWRGRAPASRGATVAWKTANGLVRGVTAGIDDQGALLIRVDDRTERVVGGEITWE